MASKQLVVTLYRSLLRNARVLDSCKEFKALLPPGFSWGSDRQCDFFNDGVSCAETVRHEFRLPLRSPVSLDEAMELNKMISERVHLLYCEESEDRLFKFTLPPYTLDFSQQYAGKREKALSQEDSSALRTALHLVQSASEVLKNEELSSADRERIAKKYYEESINSFETADARAYLGWHYYLDGELEKAVTECQRAMELDPLFGNAYNDLGLIRVQQGMDDEAVALFTKAKQAPRNDVRHFPSLNLAALYLERDQVKLALHEYIEALHWLEPEEARPIRATVVDMATFIITLAEKMRTVG